MASASMILDRTAPINGSLSATPGLGRVTLSWSNFSDSGSGLDNTLPYTLVASAAGTPASCSSGGGVSTLYTGASSTFTHNTTSGPQYYRVCATDKAGNIDTGATASATPLTNRPPVANAGPDQTGTVGTAIYFDGSASLDSDGSVVSYKYAFGDGSVTSANAGVVSHVYGAAGTYTMTLTVTDNLGATSTDTALVTVGSMSPAQGNFGWAKGLGGPRQRCRQCRHGGCGR
jgi:chitodextrinase